MKNTLTPWLKSLTAKIFKPKKDPLPQISTPYNQAVKKQQEALALSLIITVAVASFYTYFYVQDQIKSEDRIEVIVAATDINAPQIITDADLKIIHLPRKVLPIGFYLKNEKNKLIGKTLLQPIKSKQLLLDHYVQPDLDPDSISARFDKAFAFSMDEDWFAADFPDLKSTDHIDLIVTNPKRGLEQTTVLVRSVAVLAVNGNGHKQQLVINITEEQAQSILFARGLKLPMQVLVHSAITPPLTTP